MALVPRVFVHEFITGGGCPSGDLPHGLASEGTAMLTALLADFRSWGAVTTVTTLDERLAHLSLPADQVVRIAPSQHQTVFFELVANSDAVLVLAPETDGILAELSAMVERTGRVLLGSNSAAVTVAGDKGNCYERFCRAGLPTPATCRARFATAPQIAAEIGYPLVAKPVDGVGCEGVCLVTEPAKLADALAMVRLATRHEEIILQRYVVGTHASVSLLVAPGQALAISLNGQDIEAGGPFVYRGGQVPLVHPVQARAFEVAQAAVGLVPGLRGYVGVDMILTQQEAFLIEINPRLTTSCVGLRQVAQFNLARVIWEACCEGRLPEYIRLAGSAVFGKGGDLTGESK
jgi:tyramine---L-glutamate ligase